MSSTKPYLIRAIHAWCADEGYTPYLAVRVDAHTRVPREFVRDGQIVLNIGAAATHQLVLGNEEITFQARFGGVPFPVVVPVAAVQAIYARENGQGMAFEAESPAAATDIAVTPAAAADEKVGADGTAAVDGPVDDGPPPRRGGHLSLVK